MKNPHFFLHFFHHSVHSVNNWKRVHYWVPWKSNFFSVYLRWWQEFLLLLLLRRIILKWVIKAKEVSYSVSYCRFLRLITIRKSSPSAHKARKHAWLAVWCLVPSCLFFASGRINVLFCHNFLANLLPRVVRVRLANYRCTFRTAAISNEWLSASTTLVVLLSLLYLLLWLLGLLTHEQILRLSSHDNKLIIRNFWNLS